MQCLKCDAEAHGNVPSAGRSQIPDRNDAVRIQCVYVSVRFKDAVVRRSITTAELDSFASREVPAHLFGSVVLGAIDAARSNRSRYPS